MEGLTGQIETGIRADLIVVDGGKTQLAVFVEVFKNTNIPIVGLAKRHESLVYKVNNTFKEYKIQNGPQLNLLQRVRDEAHRFARRYHHTLVKKDLFGH